MALVHEIEGAAQLVARNLSVVQRVSRECRTYYTGLVSDETVIHWLLQFRDPASVEIALRLLAGLHFVDAAKLAELLGRAYREIPALQRDASLISALGKAYDSGATVAYTFSKALGWDEGVLASRFRTFGPSLFEEAARQNRPLVLLDDNIASGIQLERLINELFPEFPGTREHLSAPLDPVTVKALEGVPIHIALAMELGKGRERVTRVAASRGLSVTISSGHQDFGECLAFGGPLWESKAQSESAAQAISQIARELYRDNTGWSAGVLEDRLLGFGNLQKLVAFAHNVPKALLPVFWKFGTVGERDWFPLFPERREWAAYEDRIRDAGPETRAIARLVANGAFGAAAPTLSACISVSGEPADGVTASIPDLSSVSMFVDSQKNTLAAIPAKLVDPGTVNPMLAAFGPSPQGRAAFNAAVDKYALDSIPAYLEKVASYVSQRTRWFSFPFRVYNDGSKGATEVVLDLEMPEGVTWTAGAPGAMPKAPIPPNEPKIPAMGFDLSSIRPISDHFEALQSTIRDAAVGDTLVREVRDRGRTIVRLRFGKVLHGAFVERELRGLNFASPGMEFSIPYRLHCEELPRAMSGLFRVQLKEVGMDPARVRKRIGD